MPKGIPKNGINRSWFKKGCISLFKGKKTGRVPKSAFKKGYVPWNKDKKNIYSKETLEKMSLIKKGRHISPATEFQKGRKRSIEDKKKDSLVKIGSKNPQWKGGISFEPYALLFNQQLKERVRVRDNFICQLCGVPELECKTRLSIHHIDYDKKNCKEDNLTSLCKSCNSRVNSKREYWKQYFQQREELIMAGNADVGNVKGQEVKNLGGNKKSQGNDDLIAKNSASIGGAGAPTDKSLETNKNTPHGQKMVG